MKNRSLVLGAIAAVVVVVLWWFMVYSGMTTEASDVEKDVTAAEATNASLTRELAALEELQANADAISAEREALTRTLTAEPDLAAFIREADYIGFVTEVDWVSVSPTDPVQTGSIATTALTIEVEGEYANVLHYLRALEDAARLVVVDGVVLSGGDAADSTSSNGEAGAAPGGPPRLRVSLTARMFSLSAVQAPPTATTETTVPAASTESGA